MYERTTRQLLKELGMPTNILGYTYNVEAITIVAQDPSMIHGITKHLYPMVAQRHNTTPVRVERAMRHAIEVTFSNSDVDVVYAVFGNTISVHRGKPTNSQFIATVAECVYDRVEADSRWTV